MCKGNKVKGSAAISGITTTLTRRKLGILRVKYSPGTSSAVLLQRKRRIPAMLRVCRRGGGGLGLRSVIGVKCGKVIYMRTNNPAPKLKYTKHKVVATLRGLRRANTCRGCRPSMILCSILKSIIYNKFSVPVQGKCTSGVFVIASKRGVTVRTNTGVTVTMRGFGGHKCTALKKLVLGQEGILHRRRGMRRLTRSFRADVMKALAEDSLIRRTRRRGGAILRTFPRDRVTRRCHVLTGTVLVGIERGRRISGT